MRDFRLEYLEPALEFHMKIWRVPALMVFERMYIGKIDTKYINQGGIAEPSVPLRVQGWEVF